MAKPRARAPGPQRDRPPLPEDVTYHHCHATAEDLTRRIAAFEAQVNQDACAVADCLWVKDHLNPEEEKRRNYDSETRRGLTA